MNSVTFTVLVRDGSTLSADLASLLLAADDSVASLLTRPELWASGVGVVFQQVDRGTFKGTVETHGSLSDAWCAAALFSRLTSLAPDDVLVMVDSDVGDSGDFMVVEAVDELPSWMDPDLMNRRFALGRGCLLCIPVALSDSAPVAERLTPYMRDIWISDSFDSKTGGLQAAEATRFWVAFLADSVLNAAAAASAVHVSSLVDAAIGSRMEREVKDFVSLTHRACPLLTSAAAHVIVSNPGRANAALLRYCEWAGCFDNPTTALAAQEALKELAEAASREDRFLLQRDDASRVEAVKVSVTLPRFVFAMSHFTMLPGEREKGGTEASSSRDPRVACAELGIKMGIGLTLLLSDGAHFTFSGPLLAADVTDYGDSTKWMEEYAAEAAAREENWTKGDLFDAMLAQVDLSESDSGSSSSTDATTNSSSGGDEHNADDDPLRVLPEGAPLWSDNDVSLSLADALELHYSSEAWRAMLSTMTS